MVTKAIFARASRLKSRVSTAQNAPSPAPKAGVQQYPPATQSQPTSAAPQHQRASRTSQTPSQPPATNPQTQSCPPVSVSAPSQPPTASTASPQTQSYAPVSTLAPSQPLPPISSTPAPRTQSSSSISAASPPQSPNASTPGLQTQSSSSTLASTLPRPPNLSTVCPQTQSHASNPGPGPPQTSMPTPLAHPCPPSPNSIQGQTPAAGTASPQTQSSLSTLASAVWAAVQRNWKIFLGGCITVALAFAGVYLSGLYGKVTLKYTRWTQHNDFRDGCITDRDHNLTLAEECFAELARPRVSAVNVKRHLEAVQDACVNNAFYWTVAICIPALTCVFYLVWMRTSVRDGPRPVISPVKMDFNNSGHGQHGNGISTDMQIDQDLYDLSDVREDKVSDHQQQAAMDATPSIPGSDEDYFQAWRDGMKSPEEDSQAAESDTESTHSYLLRRRPALSLRAGSARIKGPSRPSQRKTSLSSVRAARSGASSPPLGSNFSTEEISREIPFGAKFEPSMNRVKCQKIVCDGPASEFQPTDGILLGIWRTAEYGGESEFILRIPFERGATAIEWRQMVPPSAAVDSWSFKLPKRATWARRLGLPSHRFVYVVVTEGPQLPRTAR
jgi:hypothetical protein